MKKIIIEV